MAATKKAKGDDDVTAKVKQVIEEVLEGRERRQKEESDPKARFDRVMDRLEGFLDGLEEGDGKEGKGKGEEGDGDSPIYSIFGGRK